ncbi:MAG: hypothetical protein J6S69_09940 [Proteobacteria bacterium]|nr:hypothetical protein [Pseudomonadota bacterium]
MKNRNALVFALCAMLGAAGTLACSDDSAFKVTPESLSLAAYGTQSVQVTNATAASEVSVTSNNVSCVEVINADTIVTDATGSTNFVVAATGNDCEAKLIIEIGDETQTIKATVAAATGPAPTGDFVLTLDPTILDISGVGGEASTKITYKQGENPAGGRQLKVSKVGGEDGCVEFSTSPVTNLNNGTVDFKVKALKDSCNVKLLIEDALPSITGEEKELSVYVGGNANQKVEGSVKFIEPVDETLEIIHSVGKGKFKIEVLDQNSKGLADTKVTLNNSNTDCIKLDVKSITTDATGVAEGGVSVKAANCEATLTASAIGQEASITIKVLDQDKFDVNTKLVYDNPMYEMINFAAVHLSTLTCEEWADTDPQEFAELEADDAKEGLNGVEPALVTFKLVDIEIEKKSVIAYGKANGNDDSPVLAYGCRNVGVADHDTTVDINLSAVPVELKGEYELVSNFDIAGAFTKDASTSLPVVENMIADDWIKFVKDFFKDPIKTLIDFIWVNSVARLAEIDGMPKFIADLLADNTTKGLVSDALKPMITDALKDYGWFTTITTISPDIEDLVSNMQLGGTMTVTETKLANGQLEVTNAKQSYNSLQYRWSLEKDLTKCATDVYSKEGECRMIMSLKKGKHDASIEGAWTGLTDTNESKATVLNIDDHELALKWANILYMAVFGEILPKALDYSTEKSVTDGNYIKAFLETLLFKPVVDNYNTGRVEYNKTNSCTCTGAGQNEVCTTTLEDGKCRQVLKQVNTCERFIEALVYMVAPVASDYSSLIGTVATLACGDQGIGQLEKLVNDSLTDLQVKFNTSAEGCVLDSKATTQYMSMGEPDELAHSANDVFKNGSNIETTRCTWNMDITSSHSMNGLFHATRIED